MPHAREEASPVKGHPVAGVDVAVGADQGRLGVEDQSVKIEDEGPDHSSEPLVVDEPNQEARAAAPSSNSRGLTLSRVSIRVWW